MSRTAYDAEGEAQSKVVWSYDERGRATEQRQYAGETLRYKVVNEYDGKGRLLKAETAEFNATPGVHVTHAPEPGRVVYAYDERGEEVGRSEFNEDGTPRHTELHFYDDIFTPGSPFRGTLKGESLAEVVYDAHGNWTKKTLLIRPPGAARRVRTAKRCASSLTTDTPRAASAPASVFNPPPFPFVPEIGPLVINGFRRARAAFSIGRPYPNLKHTAPEMPDMPRPTRRTNAAGRGGAGGAALRVGRGPRAAGVGTTADLGRAFRRRLLDTLVKQ